MKCASCRNIGGRHAVGCPEGAAPVTVSDSVEAGQKEPAVQPGLDEPRFRVNEVFYSLQGEGVRAGMPHVFVRFAGCNLRCVREREGFDCDTQFEGGRDVGLGDLVAEVESSMPRAWKGEAGLGRVLLTGGEPGLQVTEELVAEMRRRRWRLSIETNGTVSLPTFPGAFDWITLSPKTAEHTLRLGAWAGGASVDEVKYVLRAGQALPKPSFTARHYLISPAFQGDGAVLGEDLRWCIGLVEQNPSWRLSCQQHKWWGVR